MSNEIGTPPSEPVWWFITDKTNGTPAFTKARLWVEARNNFGGDCHPERVTDENAIHMLEARES
jgi:hypothetical protein